MQATLDGVRSVSTCPPAGRLVLVEARTRPAGGQDQDRQTLVDFHPVIGVETRLLMNGRVERLLQVLVDGLVLSVEEALAGWHGEYPCARVVEAPWEPCYDLKLLEDVSLECSERSEEGAALAAVAVTN
jgi:hypothetical protein